MYARLKDLLFYIKTCHEYPKWFDKVAEKELIDELTGNKVIYFAKATITTCSADFYDKKKPYEKEILAVNETRAKELYGIDFNNI